MIYKQEHGFWCVTPDEGKHLFNGTFPTEKAYADTKEKLSVWYEIDEEEYQKYMAQQEEQTEAETDDLLNSLNKLGL